MSDSRNVPEAFAACDKCGRVPVEAYAMPIGGGSNVILCRLCWGSELNWRSERNQELQPFARFDLPHWPGFNPLPSFMGRQMAANVRQAEELGAQWVALFDDGRTFRFVSELGVWWDDTSHSTGLQKWADVVTDINNSAPAGGAASKAS